MSRQLRSVVGGALLAVLVLVGAGCGAIGFRHGSTGPYGEDRPDVRRTFTPSSSIDRTGRTDVTARLQAFLDAVPDHALIAFPARAKYRIEGTLGIRRRNDIVVSGNGATFFATTKGDRTRSQWDLENLSNVIFQDMVIRGAHPSGGQGDAAYDPDLEAQHGVNVNGGERIEIRNLDISDVFGDFIYVGGNNAPLFGGPDNVWIHDVKARRNGRQGISVTAGSRILIEHNDIADVRRSTFDLEPGSSAGSVHAVTIRDNTIGAGRLLFVAGHGGGDISDLAIIGNRLHNHSIGIDLVSPSELRRRNVLVANNTSDLPAGNPRRTIMRFVNYDHVSVVGNSEPSAQGRDMAMVGWYNTCASSATGNDTGRYGAGNYLWIEHTRDCSDTQSGAPYQAPDWFTGNHLMIDVGGNGAPGAVPCPDADHCRGYIVGSPIPVRATSLRNSRAASLRTMLQGAQRYDIPMRPGNYNVTVFFADPSDDGSTHVFHLEIENQRVLLHAEPAKLAGAARTVVARTFRVTTADGVLTLDFLVNPVVSFIDIRRV